MVKFAESGAKSRALIWPRFCPWIRPVLGDEAVEALRRGVRAVRLPPGLEGRVQEEVHDRRGRRLRPIGLLPQVRRSRGVRPLLWLSYGHPENLKLLGLRLIELG